MAETPQSKFTEQVRSVHKRRKQQLTLGGFWIMARGRPIFVQNRQGAVKSTTKTGAVRKAQTPQRRVPTKVVKTQGKKLTS